MAGARHDAHRRGALGDEGVAYLSVIPPSTIWRASAGLFSNAASDAAQNERRGYAVGALAFVPGRIMHAVVFGE